MERIRILLTAAPFFGHVNALLPFARAAGRAGHEVALATGPDFVDHGAARGVDVWPVGPTSAEAGTPESLDFFWLTGDRRAADLLPRTDAWRPDLVVSEELELAGPIAATRQGARFVVHGLGIEATGDWGSHRPAIDELGRRWGVADLAGIYGSATYVSICPPTLRPPSDPSRHTLSLRPSLAESAGSDHPPIAFETLPHARTVHVTLGTVFHARRPGVLQTALAGLGDLDANLIVTVGPNVDPTDFGPQPAHVLIEPYLPHAWLLPHCDLVVSQGGAGIMFGALAHGLPQLVLPQGADQFANGAAVQRAGLGLTLEGDDVTASAVARAAARLLVEPAFRVATAAVRREIEAMPSADDVVATVTAQVDPSDWA